MCYKESKIIELNIFLVFQFLVKIGISHFLKSWTNLVFQICKCVDLTFNKILLSLFDSFKHILL